MNRMNKLALAVAAATLGAAATSTAYAGSNIQGPQLTGVALQSLESHQPVVTAVSLPSGETVDLRQQAEQLKPKGDDDATEMNQACTGRGDRRHARRRRDPDRLRGKQSANGPQLSGIALQSLESHQPVVTAVTLLAGDTIDLRQQASN